MQVALKSCAVLGAGLAMSMMSVGPASATSDTCRTTLTGGMIGNLVVNSSHDLLGTAISEPQKVEISEVTVNYFGETRYRLASPVYYLSPRVVGTEPVLGGVGSYVGSVELSKQFVKCVDKRLA